MLDSVVLVTDSSLIKKNPLTNGGLFVMHHLSFDSEGIDDHPSMTNCDECEIEYVKDFEVCACWELVE